jgi:hypothetical protein
MSAWAGGGAAGGGAGGGGAVPGYMHMNLQQLKAACTNLNLQVPSNATKPILQQSLKNHYDGQAIAVQREEMQRSQQRVLALEQSQDAQLKHAEINDVELIQCSICYEQYYDSLQRLPRVLPCGHTFCTDCLKSILGRVAADTIECPNCKRGHLLPRPAGVIDVESYEQIRTIPTNFHAKEVNVLR